MARGAHYDKYDPLSGGFRAPLAAATTEAMIGTVQGVSLDANGRVVIGTTGNSGYVGVMVVTRIHAIGEVVDIMQAGEIVDVPGLNAGTRYFVTAAGALSTVAPAAGAAGFLVGWTAEADRLIVRAATVHG